MIRHPGPPDGTAPPQRDEEARLAARKAELRTRLRHARRLRARAAGDAGPEVSTAGPGLALAEVVLGAPSVRRAGRVAAFVSLPGEPDTGPLLIELAARGAPALLPVLRADDRLEWALDDGTRRPGGRLGIPEPGGPRLGVDALGDVDVVLVPALAVDTLGHRLGQGLGCYDRALPLAAGALVVAVVHDEELLDAAVEPVPAGPLDHRVDAVATPTRWRSVGEARHEDRGHEVSPPRPARGAGPSRAAPPGPQPRG